MSDIKFEDDYQRSGISYDPTPKGMMGWLINKGIVPNKKVAEIVLMIVAILCFALTFYIIRKNFSSPSSGNMNFEGQNLDGLEIPGMRQ